jgi:hypothetical protein
MVMTMARNMIGRKIETSPYLSRILMMRDIRGDPAIPVNDLGCFWKVSMNL